MSRPEIKMKSATSRFTTTLIATLTLTPSCEAFFRNMMIGDTAMARVDPIVNRGSPAAHVHHLNGGGNLNFDATGDTLQASSCTSSLVTQDKSAYWAPWLYFQHQNGSFEDVKLALGLTAYYKYETRYNTGGDVKYSVFPKGLHMLAGDTTRRDWKGPWPVPPESNWGADDTTQDALLSKAIGFNCMNYSPGKNEATFQYPYLRSKEFLDANCPDGLRAEILFPSCWDGVNLDSDNHKSHLAYPTLLQDGTCPKTHPVYLPIMFFETIWETNAFAGVPGQFVLSNGDPTGYSYHADFIAAWDDGVQEQVKADSSCTGLSTTGEIGNCNVFAGKIQSQADAMQCKLKLDSAIQNEQTDGMLDALPGGVKITGTRHDPGQSVPDTPDVSPSATSAQPARPTGSAAVTQTWSNQPAVTKPTSAPAAATSNPAAASSQPFTAAPSFKSWAGQPGKAQSKAGQSNANPPVTFNNAAATPAAGADSVTTTTYTSGNYVVELVLVQMTTTVTATSPPAMTHWVVVDPSQETQSVKARLRRHAQHHGHSHGRF